MLLVSPHVFNTMKAICTWLKYAGMVFSTYLSIYQLSRKTSQDSTEMQKPLTYYGKRYRILLVASLLFTISVSLLENIVDGKMEQERKANFDHDLQEALKAKNRELLESFGPVVAEQKKAIVANLSSLKDHVGTTSTAIQQEITSTSLDAQRKIIAMTELNDQLLGHKLRDIADASKDIGSYFVDLKLLDFDDKRETTVDNPSSVATRVRLKEAVNRNCSPDAPNTLRYDRTTACGKATANLEGWMDTYKLFAYLDPSAHLTLHIFFELRKSRFELDRLGTIGNEAPTLTINTSKGNAGSQRAIYYETSRTQAGSHGIAMSFVDQDIFRKYRWYGEDLNATELLISLCDERDGESEAIHREHVLAFPTSARWLITVWGSKRTDEGRSEAMIKTYEARPPERIQPDGSCLIISYSIY